MLGLLYLLLAMLVGYVIVQLCAPDVLTISCETLVSIRNEKQRALFPQWFIAFPAAFVTGSVVCAGLTYIFSYMFSETGRGLYYGTLITMLILVVFIGIYACLNQSAFQKIATLPQNAMKELERHRIILIFFVLVAAFITWLMVYTFFVSDGNLYIGNTVYGDFAVHTALIRSFSKGNNFPTNFPHYPDGTIRYHFMFQFFTGVLEYLGLRIDIAFNLLSILALLCCTMLFYVFAALITKSRTAGVLGVIFFFFRSSFSGLIRLAENGPYHSLKEVFDFIKSTDVFIGRTPNEAWGLWTSNVYINQRHFGFGLTVLLLVMVAMLPYVYKMLQAIDANRRLEPEERKGFLTVFFFSKDAWLGGNYLRSCFLGILVGGIAFFNGAVVIALLLMLVIYAFFSKHRLSFLIIAVIAVVLTTLQTSFFVPTGGSIVSASFYFGFLVEDKTVLNVLKYIMELTGVGLFLAAAAALLKPKRLGWNFLAFFMPLLLTFTVSLTPDIAVNHKYLMIAMLMMNILSSYTIVRMIHLKTKERILRNVGKTAAVLLILVMLSTGVFDNIAVYNLNGKDHSIVMPLQSEYMTFLMEETNPGDIFVSYWDTVNPIFMAGCFEFLGWPYYAWSGGYNTDLRLVEINEILGADNSDTLRKLVNEKHISYIVLVPELLNDQAFDVNEENIKATYPLVYSDEDAQRYVYKTDYIAERPW